MVFELIIITAQWFLVFFFGSQLVIFVGLLIWVIWQDSVKPRLIPQAEIDALAEDWIARHDNPEEAAYGEQWRAWHRCEKAEQVKWKRIRKAINRTL